MVGIRAAAELWTTQLSLTMALLLLFMSCFSYGIFAMKYTGLNPLKIDRKKLL